MSQTFQGPDKPHNPSTAIEVTETCTEIVMSRGPSSGHDNRETTTEIVTKAGTFFNKTDGAWIFLGLLPGVMIAMGALYHHDCPVQPYIPIFLEVMGSSILVVLFMLLYLEHTTPRTAMVALILIFLFCWFITGNVWIYSIFEPNYNDIFSPWIPHCNKTLYLFAFSIITVTYVLGGLVFLCSCCCCSLIAIKKM